MGYKSILRGVGSAIRQAEREAIRTQKELEKRRLAYAKMQELEQAAFDVESYENYIDRITSLHKDCVSNYDWHAIMRKPTPAKPSKENTREVLARSTLDKYKPSFLDRLLNRQETKHKLLIEKLNKAIELDNSDYEATLSEYQTELEEFNDIVDLASRVLKRDLSAYRKVIEDLDPLSEIAEVGSQLVFDFISDSKILVTMSSHDSKIVPKQSKSLLKSGRLSIKDIPLGRYNEIYQDYICSASLRVAREIFGLLPVDEIIVTSKSKLLNKTTGKLEDQTILSVRYIRESMDNIDFNNIDPSDSMNNFVHNMGFKRSQGMNPVNELNFA